jgi:hypothetical protein
MGSGRCDKNLKVHRLCQFVQELACLFC